MKLIDKIKHYNEAYRNGEPLISVFITIEQPKLIRNIRV